jgi:hypothetical protein
MTHQEIFDKVVAHFAIQRVQAVDENRQCLYRTEDGRKCAIGALIPDEAYSPICEGMGVGRLLQNFASRGVTFGLNPTDENFLCVIQEAHDSSEPPFLTNFAHQMACIAHTFRLNPSSLEALK